MRRAVRIGGGILAALVVLWAGAGYWLWSLNHVPDPPSLNRRLPEGNVYDQYTQLVTRITEQKTLILLQRERAHSGPDAERVLKDNSGVLADLRALAGKPCMVTELTTGEKFVGALAFPGVTRLSALSARHDVTSSPSRSLDTMLAAADFSAGVMRGGATLHVTTGFLSFVPLFEAAPDILPKLSAEQCDRASRALIRLDDATTPMVDVMRAERTVRLGQLARTVAPGAIRIFRLDIPREDYEWQFLRKPKRPAYDALDAYMGKWVSEAAKPLRSIVAPDEPRELDGIMADESLAPRAMGVHFVRHAYIQARLRVLNAALALESARKRTGSYPAGLSACVHGDMLTDPFSGSPLVYGRTGSGYRLYSVGPNGEDDGGAPYTESRMSPRGQGDLPLSPTF